MIISDEMKYPLFELIANKAKNNNDREASVDLNEININRCETNQIELENWLREQEGIIQVSNGGHCRSVIKVSDDFISIYSTEGLL